MGGAALAPRRQPENTEQTRGSTTCCPVCMENYEQELAKLVAKEYEKSSSDSKPEVHQALPQWMQTAKLNNGSTKPTDRSAAGTHFCRAHIQILLVDVHMALGLDCFAFGNWIYCGICRPGIRN